MSSSDNYKLNEEKAQQRLQELGGFDSSLEREIALCRMMIENASNSGQTALAASLMTTLANLVKSHRINQAQMNNLLGREAVVKLGRQVSEIVVECLRDKHYGWEDTCMEIGERIQREISGTTNEEAVPER